MRRVRARVSVRLRGCGHAGLPALSVGPKVGGCVSPGARVAMHTGRLLAIAPPVGLGLKKKLEPEFIVKQPLGETFI